MDPITGAAAIWASMKAAPLAWTAATTAASSIANFIQQKQNYDLQKRSYETSLAREDTAVQRRMADVINAGLSPTLAAGNAATTQSGFSASAPQISDIGSKTMAMMTQNLSLDQTRAQTDMINAQKDGQLLDNQYKATRNQYQTQKAVTDIANVVARTKNISADSAMKEVQTAIATHNYNYFQTIGLPTNQKFGELSDKIALAMAAVNTPTLVGNSVNHLIDQYKSAKEWFSEKFPATEKVPKQPSPSETTSRSDKQPAPGETADQFRARMLSYGYSRSAIDYAIQLYKLK